MTSDELYYISGISRLIERMTLSIVIVLVSIILIISFWKSIQKIDFSIKNEKNSISTSLVLVTPIFVLLILVIFSFVSFSHPMLVKVNSNNNITEEERTYSFFGGGTKEDVTKVIDIIHMADDSLSSYELNTDKIKLKEASAFLKIAKKDLATKIYGDDLIAECQASKHNKNQDLECKKIMEWF